MCSPGTFPANSGVALVDSQLRFIYVNEVLAGYHGRTVNEYPGQDLSAVLPHEIWELVAPLYKHVIKSRSPIQMFEFYIQLRPEKILCRARYLPSEDGGFGPL